MAANISVDAWFDEVIPAAQLCPNKIIRADIVNACRDFCKRTMLWTQQVTPIDVVADTAEYDLALTGADVCGADRATFNGKPMNPVSETALDEDPDEDTEWRTLTSSTPERYFVNEKYQIRLVYIPSAALTAGLVVTAFAMPSEGATEVPLFLYNEFKECIAWGAKGRLKMRPDLPWTDLNTGASWMITYEQMLIPAMQKKHTGFQRVKTRDIIRTRYHDF